MKLSKQTQITMVAVGFLVFIAVASVAGMYIARGIGSVLQCMF